MDALDAAIIRELKRDARAPFVGIAQRVGSSEATVRARVKRLQEQGVLQGFTARVRGAAVRAMVEVAIRTNVETAKVAQRVLGLPGVHEVWEVTGEYDIVVIADVESTDDLNNLVESIRGISETTSTRTRVILSEKF